jgi:hypothetical protein
MNIQSPIWVCRKCGEILHSTDQHHFVQCSCPNGAFVDDKGYRRGAVDLKAMVPALSMSEAKRTSHLIKEKNNAS